MSPHQYIGHEPNPGAPRRESAGWKAEALDDLRALLPPGSTVHTVLRNVSRSGMTRSIDAYYIEPGDRGEVVKHWLSYRIAAVLDLPYDREREAVKVSGAGMDMGFWLVYALSRKLYPDGYTCTGEAPRCPAEDHNNPPHPARDGAMRHGNGGYALVHRWL